MIYTLTSSQPVAWNDPAQIELLDKGTITWIQEKKKPMSIKQDIEELKQKNRAQKRSNLDLQGKIGRKQFNFQHLKKTQTELFELMLSVFE